MPLTLPLQPSDTQRRLQLDEGWQFFPDTTAKLTVSELDKVDIWRPARVGLSWNVQFEDLREYMGAAWYRIQFEAPLTRNMRHVLLKFGAVDYFCEVYLNRVFVGSHEGGYTPFSFDVSNFVREGDNELAIRVVDPPMDEELNQLLFPDMLYNEIPHGKQNWYVQNSGIWQGVRLEFTPAIYIDRIDVTPQMDGQFRIDVKLGGEGLDDSTTLFDETRVKASIRENTGRLVWESTLPLIKAESLPIHGRVLQPRIWGPQSPALYTLDVALEGAISYRRRTRFGFRELTASNRQLFLNGKPFYMIGVLDQDFYPETIHTPASENFVRDMMLKAKQLGINVLRCHLKVAHPVYLDVADELGMLVWAELPSWSDCWFPADHFSYKAAQRAEQMFAEIMMRDWNHPCLAIQTVMNESWGANLQDPEQRAWLKRTFEQVKSVLAPLGRLVIDNSACEGNFHVKTDIEDFHNYYSQPDQANLWDQFVADFASRPAWTFSPFGDAERTGEEPLVVSEFGNWGLPKLPTELPWWFHHSFGQREVTRPSGVLERFESHKLARIFGNYDEFAEDTQWHQFYSLKYEIESLRIRPEIQGYCATGMTDVHWEVNGLLDMWRNDKVFTEDLQRLQEPDCVIASFPTLNYRVGDTVDVPVVLSHFSARDIAGARVLWGTDTGQGGVMRIAESIAPGTVTTLGNIRFSIPPLERPTAIVLTVVIRGKNGSRICENTYTLYGFPTGPPPEGYSICFHDPLGTAAGLDFALQAAGYNVAPSIAPGPDAPTLVLSTTMDEMVMRHLNGGGRALILADSEEAFPATAPLSCVKRAATWLDGRWFSNYNWIDPAAAPYRELAFHRLLAFESRYTVPAYVIAGVEPREYQDVLSGITLGWLNLNNALTLQTAVGPGKALITTFRFSRYESDPYSTHLLDAYLRYVHSDEFQPGLQWLAKVESPLSEVPQDAH
jgi:glycosyl hydrolase family 2